MNFDWKIFIDLGAVSLGLLLASFFRWRFHFFQRFLIPNALTAGFILLFFYNFLAPHIGMSSEGLGELVYHLLSISFVAMTLRKSPGGDKAKGKRIFSFSLGVISQYAVQALVALLLTFIFFSTVMPDLFPSFGFLVPIGFSLGPGQAYAIGEGWTSFGFTGGGTVGLTFAAIGFLLACFGGVFLINYGLKKGWMRRDQLKSLDERRVKSGFVPRGKSPLIGSHLTTESEAIDSMTYNTGIVLISYLGAYLFLKLLTFLLSFAGSLGMELAVNLWGISFIFAALIALLIKKLMEVFKIDHTLDNGTLTRISGLSVDVMVTSAIAAISLVVVRQYWFPILAMSAAAGLITFVTVPWFCSRIFTDHRFHRTLMIFGVATGTLPTGLALLRVIDPDFETPVASDYMYSAGITFMLAIPFILAINLPAYTATTGNPLFFWLSVLVAFAYLVFVILAFLIISRKRAFRSASKVWLHEE